MTTVKIKAILKPNSDHFAACVLGKIEKSKGNKLNSVAVEAIPKTARKIKKLSLNMYLGFAKEMECLIKRKTNKGLCIHNHLTNSGVISNSLIPP